MTADVRAVDAAVGRPRRPAPPRRLLLVTGAIGEGHHAAARAVEERARRLWPGVEVRWTETLSGMGPPAGPLFRAVYAGCVRRLPWLYELYFQLLWHLPPFRAATRAVIGAWSARGLARQLRRHDPDLVVATFPEAVCGLARLRGRGLVPVPVVALVTDPAPHPLWADPRLDLHLVSTAPGAALLERAAPGALVRVAGLPVASRFAPPAGRARARPLVYVSCGSMAFGDLPAACAAILDVGADVLVSAGRVAAVRRRLDRLARAHPGRMRVVDWVADPAAATRNCDVVVTNAGGATALEAVACARPLLLFAPIPGHGRANARILAEAGLARVCPRPADLAAAVADLLDARRRDAVVRQLRARCCGDLGDGISAVAGLRATHGTPRGPVRRPGQRVRAQDALFLHISTAQVPQQVGARIMIEDPVGGDDWPEYVAGLVRARAPHIDLLCRRPAPPRIGCPARWQFDAAPDPHRHVRPGVVEVGPGHDHPSWDDAVSAFFARAIDPVATGWELQIARERATGSIGVLAKVHHAIGDGIAVTDALTRLLTDEAEHRPPGRRSGALSVPPAALGSVATGLRGVVSLARAGTAGPSSLTGRLGRHPPHRIGVCLDGAGVRAAARAHGVGTTVVLLAVVSDALHALLAARDQDDDPPTTVRAMVPVTTRTAAEVPSRAPGNRTAAVSVDLPVGPMTVAERVTTVAAALAAGSSARQREGAAAALTVLGLLPSPLQARIGRLVYGRRFFHLLASVMPGSRRALHVRGGLVHAVYPVLPLADGVGLAIGALHWGNSTTVGITADLELVPDVERLPDHLRASLAACGEARG